MDGLSSALCSGVSGHLCLSIKSHSSGMNIHGCSTQKAEQTWSETTFMFHREYHESRVGSYVGQNPSAPCLLVLHLYNYPDSGHGGLHDISTAMDPSRSSLPPWPSAWQRAMLFSHIHKLPLWDLASSAASWTDESCPALPSPPWEHWTSMKPALTIEWKGLQWTLLSSASWTVCPHRASLPSGQSAMFPISSGQGTNAQPHLCSSFSCVTFPIPLPPPTTIHQRGSTCEFLLSFLFSSVQFSRSVMSDSLRPHESQHARPPCPSPTPGVYSNPCPSSRWWHPAISSSVVPFSSCPQSLPASGSFPMRQLFAWGGQSIGVSAWASVLPMNTQDW